MLDSAIDINQLEVPQLQALVTKYPWFSYAREVLLYKLVEIEPQCFESRYKESLVFFPKRENVFLKCRQITAARKPEVVEILPADLMDVPVSEVEPLEELSLEVDFSVEEGGAPVDGSDFDIVLERESDEPAMEIQTPKPKVVVVGGDYFSKDDFAQLDEQERVAEIKFGAPADNEERESAGEDSDSVDFDSLDFVTETLAKIYADQGYYDKAIEVYAKLILLYPEKSTYFATLVNEIKSKY